MKTKTNYTLIGGFIMSGVLVLVIWILTLKGASDADAYFLETYFEESITGLSPGSAIRFRGVKVGQVDEVHIASNVYETRLPYVVVTAKLYQKGVSRANWITMLERASSQGLFVRLASQGLTGAMYLEADIPSDPSKAPPELKHDWTPRYSYVASETSTIAQVRLTVDELAANVRSIDFAAIASEANNTMVAIRTQVEGAEVAELSQKAQAFLDEGTSTMQNANATIRRAGERAEEVLGKLNTMLTRIEGELTTGTLKKMLKDVTLTVEQMPAAAEDMKAAMESLMGSAEQVENLIRLKGRDVDLILENIRVVTANLSRLTSTLERYPSLLLFGEAPAKASRKGAKK